MTTGNLPSIEERMVIKNTWAEGLNPSYSEMTPDQAQILVAAKVMDMDMAHPPDVLTKLNEIGLIRIINARIDGMNLPLRFTSAAKMGILALASQPGGAVVLLIDCLNAFCNWPDFPDILPSDTTTHGVVEVTLDNLIDLYPYGFYSGQTLSNYVDNYMKPRKVKWSDVYISRM